MPDTSQPQGEKPTILDEIVEMLDQNGSITRDMKDRLMLKSLAEVIRMVEPIKALDKRVCTLEKRNIATMFIEHPLPMASGVFAIFIVLNLIAHSFPVETLFKAILKILGIPI